MDPLKQYLIDGTLPTDEKQAWKLKYKAAKYFALVGYVYAINMRGIRSLSLYLHICHCWSCSPVRSGKSTSTGEYLSITSSLATRSIAGPAPLFDRGKSTSTGEYLSITSSLATRSILRQEEGASFIGKDKSYGWQLSLQGKDGNYANDATKEVAERIDDYQTQVKEGTLEVEGTKDVLTLALGTPEHGGRVRGVGDGVTPTQYFRLIKRGSKKHVRALESKSREEEEKRKKEEQKRKKAEEKGKEERKKIKELKNKYKELEAKFNDRLTSPASEKIASNSHKSDNRDHIPPLGGAHSKRKPKNKEEKSRLLETNSEPDFRKTKKANSPIPAKNSKKENAEVTSRAPVRNHTLDLGKGRSCSLAVDFKSNVVAKGIVYEELGPETKVHNVPLGQYNSHVAVGKILEGKEQALLPVPVGDKLKFVEDAIGSHIAWPRELVVKANQEKIGQPSKSKGDKTKSTGHSKGSDLCTSFGAMIGIIIQSGRLKFPYEQELFGDNIEFSYIETNDVKDVCNLESIESPCMVAYMRCLYEKCVCSRDRYLFVNPAVFSVADSKEKTKLVLDRLREANMKEIVFIPYNP
ncbi:hypothetical protein IFM89_016974 [Coptis chinensis]|uniref:DUF8039 domain-containing protein n=1 Tax=Coptis chinensis TaxID=261450 RepID=A0A835HWB6_9MAGN|nr:hypothetical protein IFM89_016974 [Coptis chinensis]